MNAQHVKLELSQSDEEAHWRNCLVLRAGMERPPGYHAYAPEVTCGCRPLKLEVPATERYCSMPPVTHPNARLISLPAPGENLPVFEGRFDVTTEAAIEFAEFEQGTREERFHKVEIQGGLQYQTCDDKAYFPPKSRPVSWTVKVRPYDQEQGVAAEAWPDQEVAGGPGLTRQYERYDLSPLLMSR